MPAILPRLLLHPAVLAAALCLPAALPAAAEPTAPPGWQISCRPGACIVARSVTASKEENPKPAATLLIGARSNGTHFIGALVPLGVALQPGVRLIHGDETIAAAMEVCLPDGCRAVAELTPEQIATLRQADSVDLRFFALNDARQMSIPFPTDGIAAAIDSANQNIGTTTP